MSPVYDVAVIGGGPAGSAAAITAARSGARVLLVEAGKFPRHKVCGEFISPEAIAVLQILLGPDSFRQLVADAPRVTQTRIYLDGVILGSAIDPAALSVSRFHLDHSLWQAAQESGVDCRSETPVEKTIRDGGEFQITPGVAASKNARSDGPFRARSVIDATGRWSNLRVTSTIPPAPEDAWLGIKAHFACPEELSDSVDLYFFKDGYCGVQPVGLGAVNACGMVRSGTLRQRGASGMILEVLQRHPELALRSRGWQASMPPVATFPLVFRSATPVEGAILRAGDAACFIDPFVGDGISLAMRTGVLAAERLAEVWRGSMTADAAAARYEAAYRRMYAPVFRASARLRRVLTLPRGVRRSLMQAARLTGLGPYLVKSTRPPI